MAPTDLGLQDRFPIAQPRTGRRELQRWGYEEGTGEVFVLSQVFEVSLLNCLHSCCRLKLKWCYWSIFGASILKSFSLRCRAFDVYMKKLKSSRCRCSNSRFITRNFSYHPKIQNSKLLLEFGTFQWKMAIAEKFFTPSTFIITFIKAESYL